MEAMSEMHPRCHDSLSIFDCGVDRLDPVQKKKKIPTQLRSCSFTEIRSKSRPLMSLLTRIVIVNWYKDIVQMIKHNIIIELISIRSN